ncbi:MAG TPA: S41 family peptidase [Longimicrobiaceae bacterium]
MKTLVRTAVAAVVVALGAGCAPASAQVDAATRREVVDSVARVVERLYVSPDTGRLIAERLRRLERAGAYGEASTFPQLAQALTADLQALNGDGHLNVRHEGDGPSSGGPSRVAPQEPANGGIEEVRRLEGNVGYLRLSRFAGEGSLGAATEALRALGDTDAMIFDVRGVPGGTARMSNFIISHFTAPRLLSLSRYDRARGDTIHRYTLAEVPGPRRPDVPLYVLTDGRSFSAAEDFAFVLQSLGRAVVVGERTGGGGRNNRHVPVGHGLVLSVSHTNVFDPRTGKGWEKVGVQPDVAVPAADALTAAHREALKKLGRS